MYAPTNPVTAGLVARVDQWPGGTACRSSIRSGCGHRAPPAARDDGPAGTEIAIPTELDDRAIAAITVGAAPVDLWARCDRGDVASIDVRAATGAFVHGDCAHRAACW